MTRKKRWRRRKRVLSVAFCYRWRMKLHWRWVAHSSSENSVETNWKSTSMAMMMTSIPIIQYLLRLKLKALLIR